MALITNIRTAASEVGVEAIITNSNEALETQLRRLNKETNLPILLISWDMDKALSFNSNGYLNDPKVSIVSLLLSKPEDLTKEEAEKVAEEMGAIFEQFLMKLYNLQAVLIQDPAEVITAATYKLLPRYGIHKHSGVLGKFTVADAVVVPCINKVDQWTLTLSSDINGSIAPFSGATKVDEGGIVSISSLANPGFVFEKYVITVNGVDTDELSDSFDVVVTADTFVAAQFIPE